MNCLTKWPGLGQIMKDVLCIGNKGRGKSWLNPNKELELWKGRLCRELKSLTTLPIPPISCQCLPLAEPSWFRGHESVGFVHKFSLLKYASGGRKLQTGSSGVNENILHGRNTI